MSEDQMDKRLFALGIDGIVGGSECMNPETGHVEWRVTLDGSFFPGDLRRIADALEGK